MDDTQTTALAVPSTWTEIETVPDRNSDGSARPWISATTDESQFFPGAGADTFSVPGVIYIAAPYDPATDAMLASTEYDDVCVAGPVEPYANANFTGHQRTFTECGGTATSIVIVTASPADHSFTAMVLVQLTGEADDAATLDGLLNSFGRHVPAG